MYMALWIPALLLIRDLALALALIEVERRYREGHRRNSMPN